MEADIAQSFCVSACLCVCLCDADDNIVGTCDFVLLLLPTWAWIMIIFYLIHLLIYIFFYHLCWVWFLNTLHIQIVVSVLLVHVASNITKLKTYTSPFSHFPLSFRPSCSFSLLSLFVGFLHFVPFARPPTQWHRYEQQQQHNKKIWYSNGTNLTFVLLPCE